MDIFVGVGILAATVLLLSSAYGAHCGPVRAAWVSWPGASMMTCVALTLLGPVGLGFVIRGGLHPIADLSTANPVAIAVAIGLAGAAFVASPILIRPARRVRLGQGMPVADNGNRAPTEVLAA